MDKVCYIILTVLVFAASAQSEDLGSQRAPNWLQAICSWFGFCNEICYGDLGCFDTTLTCHRDFFPPLSPEEINTYYVIYNRKTEGNPLYVTRSNATRENLVGALGDRRITFIVHGWGEGIWKEWVGDLRDALLEKEDINVVLVDWSDGADSLNYLKAVQNIRVVGREMGMFLQNVHEYTGHPYDKFHLIGHSLGAHAAGFAGQMQPGLGRISALDAAGPSFEGTDSDCRLDKTDALYVDAIHTDSGALSGGGVGISQKVGHSDFYPNGGYAQPGCRWWMVGCSHARSHLYFIESVRLPQCRFAAIPCDNEEDFVAGRCQSCGEKGCKLMGYFTDDHANGTYYLSTRGHSPYCTKMKFYWRKFYLLREKMQQRTIEAAKDAAGTAIEAVETAVGAVGTETKMVEPSLGAVETALSALETRQDAGETTKNAVETVMSADKMTEIEEVFGNAEMEANAEEMNMDLVVTAKNAIVSEKDAARLRKEKKKKARSQRDRTRPKKQRDRTRTERRRNKQA